CGRLRGTATSRGPMRRSRRSGCEGAAAAAGADPPPPAARCAPDAAAGCGADAIAGANPPHPCGHPDRGGLKAAICYSLLRAARFRGFQGHFDRATKRRERAWGALTGNADRDRVRRGACDVSAIHHFRSVVAVTGLAFEARIAGGVTVISDGLRTGATLKAE